MPRNNIGKQPFPLGLNTREAAMFDAGLQIQMWDNDVQIQVAGSQNARRVTNRLRRRGIDVARVTQLDGTSNILISMRSDKKLTVESVRALVGDIPGLTAAY